jgi:hypothetical protein
LRAIELGDDAFEVWVKMDRLERPSRGVEEPAGAAGADLPVEIC